MNIIVAADKNWAIGENGKLLVSIPSDMKFFRQTTTGNVVVMGRKTLESFPGGLPLKNRTNIVLTRNENYKVKDAIIVHSIPELLKELEKYPNTDMLEYPIFERFGHTTREHILSFKENESDIRAL